MEELKVQINKLSSATGEERDIHLVAIKNIVKDNRENKVIITYLVASSVIVQVTKAIKEHSAWISNPPYWVYNLIHFNYLPSLLRVPRDQTLELVEAISEILSKCEKNSRFWFDSLRVVIGQSSEELLACENLYSTLKYLANHKEIPIQLSAISMLCLLTHSNMDWRIKLLEDIQFLQTFVGLASTLSGKLTYWGLFVNLAQHECAKTCLPREVITLAQETTIGMGSDIYATLCSENTANSYKVNTTYVGDLATKLKGVLSSRLSVDEVASREIPEFGLIDLVCPLANLSIEEGNTELLAEHGIAELFLEVLQIDENSHLTFQAANLLSISKLKASEGLWDLAMRENVRPKIIDANGVEILRKLLADIPKNDKMHSCYQSNIKGTIFSLSNYEIPQKTEGDKHIMISYNNESRAIVIKIFHELTKHGYRVWVNLTGECPETVVHAIEGAEIVLMCISQRYKDTPNCKFEAHYATKRNIARVPLVMQADYSPEGWLKTITGSDSCHPFFDESAFESNLQRVLTALGNRCKTEYPPSVISTPPAKFSLESKGTHFPVSSQEPSSHEPSLAPSYVPSHSPRAHPVHAPSLSQAHQHVSSDEAAVPSHAYSHSSSHAPSHASSHVPSHAPSHALLHVPHAPYHPRALSPVPDHVPSNSLSHESLAQSLASSHKLSHAPSQQPSHELSPGAPKPLFHPPTREPAHESPHASSHAPIIPSPRLAQTAPHSPPRPPSQDLAATQLLTTSMISSSTWFHPLSQSTAPSSLSHSLLQSTTLHTNWLNGIQLRLSGTPDPVEIKHICEEVKDCHKN